MYQKNIINWEFTPTNFDPSFVGPIFEQLLKFIKKSKFGWNQFKVDTQHKDMYTKKNLKFGNYFISILTKIVWLLTILKFIK